MAINNAGFMTCEVCNRLIAQEHGPICGTADEAHIKARAEAKADRAEARAERAEERAEARAARDEPTAQLVAEPPVDSKDLGVAI